LSAECTAKKIENWSIIAEDMDKRKVPRFLLDHAPCNIVISVNSIIVL